VIYHSHDGQAAEDDNRTIYFGEPGYKPSSFCLNLIICLFDKGKPVEKRGRKAVDLKL
jgi:hypothetical protein